MGATLVTSLLATLAHPQTWILALASFLVRGGIIVFLIPIFVLPTPVGLANLTGPTVVGFVLGGLSIGLLALLVFSVVIVIAWIVLGGFLAATLEIEGIRIVAADEDVAASAPSADDAAAADWRVAVASAPDDAFDPTRQALRILAARMALLFPLLVAVIWASARTVAATYAELTLPSDVTIPIAWRIVAAVPDAIVVVLIVWLIGEILGGIAARRIVARRRLDRGRPGRRCNAVPPAPDPHARAVRAAGRAPAARGGRRRAGRHRSRGTDCGPRSSIATWSRRPCC